jgi:diaminohydroxyphosphoribosylaminopyrimidine deaminase/5-amino-6-(5-phosphoribosylamino)uracil reductase
VAADTDSMERPSIDRAFMDRALARGETARRRTAPNPWVGAVVVRDGEIVGHGATQPPGGAHAEIEALREAGVDVAVGEGARAATRQLAPYLHHRRTGRAFCVAKAAVSLDGRTAARDGSSQWITGEEARADVHEQRSRCGAILVGTGTALLDDPQLTARKPDGSLYPHQPIRVVMGERDLPPTARVLDDAAPTWQLRTRDPKQVLTTLAGAGVHHVWLEGGPTVAAAFMAGGLVDQIIAYVAPVLLGRGRPSVSDLGITTIDHALRLRPTDITLIGHDVRITAALKESI